VGTARAGAGVVAAAAKAAIAAGVVEDVGVVARILRPARTARAGVAEAAIAAGVVRAVRDKGQARDSEGRSCRR
jgi:hypothetical protein